MRLLILIVFGILFSSNSWANEALGFMKSMTETYSKVEFMKAKITRYEKSAILGTSDTVTGKLEYSKGKVRLVLNSDPKSTFILGKTHFWQILGKKQATKGKVNQAVPNVFAAIFTDPDVWDKMAVREVSKKNGSVTISVNTKGHFSFIQNLVVTIDSEKKTLLSLSYEDDVNNTIRVKFRSTRFKKEAPKGRFSFIPPKGMVVNNL